jgi:hypothetical protein
MSLLKELNEKRNKNRNTKNTKEAQSTQSFYLKSPSWPLGSAFVNFVFQIFLRVPRAFAVNIWFLKWSQHYGEEERWT